MAATPGEIRSDIADHDLHHIWMRGVDLVDGLMGKHSFTEVTFLAITGRLPKDNERAILDAVLVSLMEHGLTPSAAVARMTYSVAPEALQGAVAAGLLGAGSVVLGSMEECGQLLTEIDTAVAGGQSRAEAIDGIVKLYRATKRKLPGLGHVIHTEGDPRAARLFVLAEQQGLRGKHVEALQALVEAARIATGRALPINVTGAVSSILLELGIPWQLHRGFALIGRTAGLVAHIGEEMQQPITPALRGQLRHSSSRANGHDKKPAGQ